MSQFFVSNIDGAHSYICQYAKLDVKLSYLTNTITFETKNKKVEFYKSGDKSFLVEYSKSRQKEKPVDVYVFENCLQKQKKINVYHIESNGKKKLIKIYEFL
ncbi:MAG: hypothetical protein A2096_11185 [Spirochaetes bacterium GWF1_41_5]|nr:MAG: hypothetical protein A2096_11185 [Spirochaetes bacterium GWF1_41_5]